MLIARLDITALLATSIGEEKAKAVVESAATELLLPDPMSTAEAMAVLEHIAGQEGLVGVAARFARSRAIFRWR